MTPTFTLDAVDFKKFLTASLAKSIFVFPPIVMFILPEESIIIRTLFLIACAWEASDEPHKSGWQRVNSETDGLSPSSVSNTSGMLSESMSEAYFEGIAPRELRVDNPDLFDIRNFGIKTAARTTIRTKRPIPTKAIIIVLELDDEGEGIGVVVREGVDVCEGTTGI